MNEIERRVLLIDERGDPYLHTALAEGGGKVTSCNSPRDAWDCIYPVPPHLIVVRLYDPNPEDVTMLQECRVMAKGAPIVVATIYEQTEVLKDVLEDRPAAFLVLPAEADEVSRLLRDLEESANRI